jgi:hypothetical protein
MPRGTRSVHGIEAPYAIHGTGAGGGDYAVMVDSDWLPIQCWCRTYVVAVPQYELRYMNVTRSCGRQDCRGPHEPFGPPRSSYILPTNIPTELDKWLAKNGVRKPRYPRHVHVRHKPVRQVPTAVARRRDMVEAAWRLSPSPLVLARALDLPLHTVNNDLMWLRRQRRL